jgi:alkylation response protein AidB-like acyl-CoA dehydrogenase
MNFEFSEDQRQLADQVGRHLREAFPIERVKAVLDGNLAERKAMWQECAAMGYLATALPEEYSGVGCGYLELCLLAQEFGRAALPVPMLSSVYGAMEALLLYGSAAQKAQWLPLLASGARTATLAFAEPGWAGLPGHCTCSVADGRISGVKTPVSDTDLADVAVVLVSTASGAQAWAIVDLLQSSVQQQPVAMLDEAWPHSTITFTGASAELLPGNGLPVERVYQHAAILAAFEQVGGAGQALEQARTYALERYAFGQPIAAYQGIKYKLVDMYVARELALSQAYFGAWALQNNAAGLPRAAAGAHLAATRAYELCATENIQIHGGVGFTWEYSCHVYFKKSRMLALYFGGERAWKEAYVDGVCADYHAAAVI